jgi:hypothetical protein
MEYLYELYDAAKSEANACQGDICDYFDYEAPTPYDEAVYSWIKLIVMKSLPLGIVEDPMFREFSGTKI